MHDDAVKDELEKDLSVSQNARPAWIQKSDSCQFEGGLVSVESPIPAYQSLSEWPTQKSTVAAVRSWPGCDGVFVPHEASPCGSTSGPTTKCGTRRGRNRMTSARHAVTRVVCAAYRRAWPVLPRMP
jgi:hypothetical protein